MATDNTLEDFQLMIRHAFDWPHDLLYLFFMSEGGVGPP